MLFVLQNLNYRFLEAVCKVVLQHYTACARLIIDQQNRALEAATVTLRYSTALCPPMGKTREIFDHHFLAKPGVFQANYCDITKVEVPNCMLTCNMGNEIVAVRA